MDQTNPFQLLTFIAAPAILTNSSSVLSLGTGNRFARAVDRSRYLYERLKNPETLTSVEIELYSKQLPLLNQRSLMLVKALSSFYLSVGSFASTAFVSILGAGASLANLAGVAGVLTVLSLLCGAVGVFGLVRGAGLLVREMYMALDFMTAETKLAEAAYLQQTTLRT